MGNGLVHPSHHLHADDGGQVFLAPIGLGSLFEQSSWGHRGQQPKGFGAAPHFHAFGCEHRPNARQKITRHTAGHQEAFGRVAGAVLLGFGVVGHLDGEVQVAGVIDIGVAIAVQVLDNRHLGLGADALDQALATARDDDVDKLRHGDELAHGIAVGGGHQLYRMLRQTGLDQGFAHQADQRLVRFNGFRAPAQDAGVATFDGQAGSLDGDAGAAFVNHAKHANGHAHLPHANAAGYLFHANDFANDVGHGRQLLAPLRAGFDHFGRELQTVHHGFRQARSLRTAQVLGVVYLQGLDVFAQQACKHQQCPVFCSSTRFGRKR